MDGIKLDHHKEKLARARLYIALFYGGVLTGGYILSQAGGIIPGAIFAACSLGSVFFMWDHHLLMNELKDAIK